MKSSKLILVLVLVAVVGLVVATHFGAKPGALAPAGPIAVCNVVEILNNCKKAKDLTAKLNLERSRIEKEVKTRNEAIDNLTKLLTDQLAPGSEAFELRFAEKQRLMINREAWLKFEQAKAMRMHQKLTQEMYAEVQKAVGVVAKRGGFKMVFHQQRGRLRSSTTPEMRAEISQRQIVYSDDAIDITANVLSSLNAAYRTKKP